MHNVRRVKRTAEQQAARKLKEANEIKKIRALTDAMLTPPPQDTLDQQFLRTTQVLKLNPENYTAWNIRRELILHKHKQQKEQQEEEQNIFTKLLIKELDFTESLLPSHPKIHWIWNHRRWVIIQLNNENSNGSHLQRELMLVDYLLNKDSRNFHGWTYRRWVIQMTNPTQEDIKAELQYTTEKINKNFSNFSAWHHRVQQIKKLAEKPSLSHELEYVHQAVGMDPQDQSGWLYYIWLLGGECYLVSEQLLHDELEFVTEIYEDEGGVWPARLICKLNQFLGVDVSSQIVKDLVSMDPMRTERYLSISHS